MTTRFTRLSWLQGLAQRLTRVGDCVEWAGKFNGTTPVTYCPSGMPWHSHKGDTQSVRSVLWALKHGERCPVDQVIRPRCGNHRCVTDAHWLVIDRKQQAVEQSRRGEFDTVKRKVANLRVAAQRSKLKAHVSEIRRSSDTGRAVAKRLGVSAAAVTAVRRQERCTGLVAGAWVFGVAPERKAA